MFLRPAQPPTITTNKHHPLRAAAPAPPPFRRRRRAAGQKQRVALARAVYSDPDVALLDDPLAAVDAATAQELVRSAVGPGGALSRALRVLATNQMWVLPLCDRVVVLDGGRVAEQGTFAELLQANGKLCEVRSCEDREEGNQLLLPAAAPRNFDPRDWFASRAPENASFVPAARARSS